MKFLTLSSIKVAEMHRVKPDSDQFPVSHTVGILIQVEVTLIEKLENIIIITVVLHTNILVECVPITIEIVEMIIIEIILQTKNVQTFSWIIFSYF